MRFDYCAETHVGCVRADNEDSAFAGPHLLLVADGVGGQAAGEVASASVAFVMSAVSMLPGVASSADPYDVQEALEEAVGFAQQHLGDGVATDPTRSGMATTLTAILTDGSRFGLAHIGDSRAYLLRGRHLSQLTTDHTLVQSLVDHGQITADEAKSHPYRSVVTRSVSGTERSTPDLLLLDLQPGDRVLLCSDGLSDPLPDHQIAEHLATSSRDAAVDGLIESALRAGGSDNITCVVGDVNAGTLMPWSRRPYYCVMRGAVTQLDNLIDPAAHARAA